MGRGRDVGLMKSSAFRMLIASVAMAGFAGGASAQGPDMGKAEYQSSCAACHGADGKGDGPMASALKAHPADLTVLAKKNNGVFPVEAVYQTIDGRRPLASHGSREMPVWGYRFVPPGHFNLKPSDDYTFLSPASPEAVVHARILSVIDYLNRIQAK